MKSYLDKEERKKLKELERETDRQVKIWENYNHRKDKDAPFNKNLDFAFGVCFGLCFAFYFYLVLRFLDALP